MGNTRELEHAYRYFMNHRVSASLEKILKKMPNNKGFIVNGIIYYGHLPPTNEGITVLFERTAQRGQNIVHEIRPHVHETFLVDKNKNTRKLLSREARTINVQ